MTPRDLLASRLPDYETHRAFASACAEVARAEGVKPETVQRSVIARSQADYRAPPERHALAPGHAWSIGCAGPPVGQGRPRVWAGGRVGQPASSEWARERWRRALVAHPVVVGPVAVSIEVRVKRRKKPDLDNIEKLILDAMTDAGIIADDVQVDRLSSARIVDGRASEGVAVTWGPA